MKRSKPQLGTESQLASTPLKPSTWRDRFALALIASTLSWFSLGCETVKSKAYPGDVRPLEELGVVAPGADYDGFTSTYIGVLEVDGESKVEEWTSGSAAAVYVLPGNHDFEVEFKEMHNTSAIPIVDLVTLAMDAATALSHSGTTIAFPVEAGVVHRTHYTEDDEVFWLSRDGPARDPVEQGPVEPPDDAVHCSTEADQSAELWCELRS